MANADGEKKTTIPEQPLKQTDVKKPAMPSKPALKPQTPQPALKEKQPVPVDPAVKPLNPVAPVAAKVEQQPSPVLKDLSKPGGQGNANRNANPNENQNASQNQNANPNTPTNVSGHSANNAAETQSSPKNPVRGGEGAAGIRSAGQATNQKTIPRPEAWEDDISRNTLDDLPFTSLPSPASRDPETFETASGFNRLKQYLNGVPVGNFLAKDDSPIPVPEDREGYSAGYDENYWMSGLEDYFKIMSVADSLGVIPRSVLDFGCATGRVVRHFANQSKIPEVWGTDINQRHVRWLYEHLPMSVKPVFNHCIPTLPIADSSVDIITAFSVFTHIDTFETHWLAELSRIMSDGGMCYLTVHNEDTWERLRGEVDNQKNRLIQSLIKIDPAFGQNLMKPMPDQRTIYRFTESGPYRAQVFHSDNYLRNVWGRFFHVEAIMPCHHVRQTVVVLRKKS